MHFTLREFQEKINISGVVLFDEPMAQHTTFHVGGPADCFVRPTNAEEVVRVLKGAREIGLPLFVLGGGANILVSDRGIRGVVMDIGALNHTAVISETADTVLFAAGAGLPISDASSAAADQGLHGIGFIYAMPGSVGGAVWMNARCYGSEIYSVLDSVDFVDEEGMLHHYFPVESDWGYKTSPFQDRQTVILKAVFRLKPGNRDELWKGMREIRADREKKGHFAAPCAGSIFKNNHRFGAPSGKIIDSIGLRGRVEGGAKISDLHANIIINTGKAAAADIKTLMDLVRREVYEKRGFLLEPEVLLVGEWD